MYYVVTSFIASWSSASVGFWPKDRITWASSFVMVCDDQYCSLPNRGVDTSIPVVIVTTESLLWCLVIKCLLVLLLKLSVQSVNVLCYNFAWYTSLSSSLMLLLIFLEIQKYFFGNCKRNKFAEDLLKSKYFPGREFFNTNKRMIVMNIGRMRMKIKIMMYWDIRVIMV